ncbi:unnamed protein product [Mortierella alpina]
MFSWSLNYRTDSIKLGKKIGSGAQAEIFKAKCGLDDVVVKRFLNSKHKSTRQEVAIIQDLTHKNVVQFYHVHHDMIVMEYVEGGSLADAIIGRRLQSWKAKTHIAKDISLGLAYLHFQGIIHCDIKSSNILLTEHQEARICDFGLATRAGESGVGGTLQWMAPELLQDPPLYTGKSDVYALGMVMWEMASESTQPYRGHTRDGMAHCILNGIRETYPDDTPKTYATCIQLCWALQPDGRPAAMNMLADIERSPYPQGEPEQQRQQAANKGEKIHYLRALEQYFKTSGSLGFVDKLKNGNMLDIGKTMDWFNSSAGGSESAKAMFKIGAMYYSGSSVERDYNKAMEWCLAASEAGVPVAMLKISQMYQYGRGVDQDDCEAASWYCQAEEAVIEQGKLNNRIVHHDAGVSEHHRRSMEWFRNALDVGTAATYLQIGNTYYKGGDLEQDYSKALEWYFKASDAGDTDAMLNIGSMYRTGQGVEQDDGKALEWYLKASDTGNAKAMFNISIMYRTGQGVEQDDGKALEWYLKASNAGNATAMFNIGVMYRTGQGVKQDDGKALEWYLKASNAGDTDAMFNIGNMYRTGQGVEQHDGKALEWYLKASEAGKATAMFNIGVMYRTGQGVEQDDVKALEWYLKAGNAGDTDAMFNIGVMYNNGRGVEQDDDKALEWYLKASDAGNTTAMFNIGVMYRTGQGVEQDDGKALEWYIKAGNAGDTDAMFIIGVMYDDGRGVEQDDDKALEWYLKASDAGNATAMSNIGFMYRTGQGAEQDDCKALEWYLKAGNAGNADAMFNIGGIYKNGQGVEQDDGKALEWYVKAHDSGCAEAGALIKELQDEMAQ